MSDDLCPIVTRAWIALLRVEQAVLEAVEAELKQAGLPPLAWYDALLELGRAPAGRLGPGELSRRMLLSQYNVSRLIDRLEAEGAVRRRHHPGDRRRQWIEITPAGRRLRQRMWPTYRAAIQRYVGDKLKTAEADRLAQLLEKLQ